MPTTAYTDLVDAFDEVVADMPHSFTAHMFLRRLSHLHQRAYIEALYEYRHSEDSAGNPTAFRTLHARLSHDLKARTDLVRHVEDVPSETIFGTPGRCARYERVNR